MDLLVPRGTRVTYAFDREQRDRYGRALVFLSSGDVVLNAELLREGFARPLRVRRTRAARSSSSGSRATPAARRGLWSPCE